MSIKKSESLLKDSNTVNYNMRRDVIFSQKDKLDNQIGLFIELYRKLIDFLFKSHEFQFGISTKNKKLNKKGIVFHRIVTRFK